MHDSNDAVATIRHELCEIIKTSPTMLEMAGRLSAKIELSDSLIDNQYDMLNDESDMLTACLTYREASEEDRNDAADELVRLTRKYLDKYDG